MRFLRRVPMRPVVCRGATPLVFLALIAGVGAAGPAPGTQPAWTAGALQNTTDFSLSARRAFGAGEHDDLAIDGYGLAVLSRTRWESGPAPDGGITRRLLTRTIIRHLPPMTLAEIHAQIARAAGRADEKSGGKLGGNWGGRPGNFVVAVRALGTDLILQDETLNGALGAAMDRLAAWYADDLATAGPSGALPFVIERFRSFPPTSITPEPKVVHWTREELDGAPDFELFFGQGGGTGADTNLLIKSDGSATWNHGVYWREGYAYKSGAKTVQVQLTPEQLRRLKRLIVEADFGSLPRSINTNVDDGTSWYFRVTAKGHRKWIFSWNHVRRELVAIFDLLQQKVLLPNAARMKAATTVSGGSRVSFMELFAWDELMASRHLPRQELDQGDSMDIAPDPDAGEMLPPTSAADRWWLGDRQGGTILGNTYKELPELGRLTTPDKAGPLAIFVIRVDDPGAISLMPEIKRQAAVLGSQGYGVTVAEIEAGDNARSPSDRFGVNYAPVHIAGLTPDNAKALGLSGAPTLYLLDAKGTVREQRAIHVK